MTEAKPLQPLSHGSILIVGTKQSNFGDEIKDNPRVIMWDSQNESWQGKDLPDNVRAIFITRFIGHSAFAKIHAEAKKKQITIFNPDGTGIIARQVKELLNMQGKMPDAVLPPAVAETTEQTKGKLKPLMAFVNFSKTNVENARVMMVEAKRLGITTTEQSLANSVATLRKKQSGVTGVPKSIMSKLDVSVEMLDSAIKDLSDMRDYLIATVEENRLLKAKLEQFKKVLGD